MRCNKILIALPRCFLEHLRKRGPDEALGRSRGGLTTKVHLLADALGRPLRIGLTGGQVLENCLLGIYRKLA